MSEVFAFPFLRPSVSRIEAGPWMGPDTDGTCVLPELLPDWDYSVSLGLQRTLELDLEGLWSDTGLGPSSSLLLHVYAATGELKLRKCIFERALRDCSGSVQLDIGPLELEGAELQGYIDLVTVLSVERAERIERLAPMAPGSRLWEDEFRCRLEGGGGRLPMEARDFSEVSAQYALAPWYFRLEESRLDDRFEAAFQVILNTKRQDVLDAVSRKDTLMMPILQGDLVRHILARLLRSEEFTLRAEDYPNGSIGAVAAAWLDAAFPDQTAGQIRDMFEQRPADFEAIVFAVFGGQHDG
ncbi:hypothetical protein [Thioalkalivibrio sp. HL-Eb18]|uniref:hypothetical protein n=1 Tax=Thioalkalivibrio sp. HL-Eb18 TaxID=1266913 RepID=UPI0003804053|nr:hypothetical protein [Thioalkalivibrio sp. HL-Eb18]